MNTPKNDVLLSLRGIHKSFGAHHVLKGIDLDVRRGEVISLVGASGSGKTSLLRCMNLLLQPDRGEILIDGEPLFRKNDSEQLKLSKDRLASMRTKTGMVFQNFNLFPHKTALENIIEAPITVKKTRKEEAVQHAHELLARMGLPNAGEKYPSQLSGGQQQRVAIARALAMKPKVMLFDEPTSALDPELVGDVLESILSLAADGMTMVVVTHEIGFACEVADRLVYMADGVISACGTPRDLFTKEQNPRFATFVSRFKNQADLLSSLQSE